MLVQALPLGVKRRGIPSGWKSTQVAAAGVLAALVKLEPVETVEEDPPGSSGADAPLAQRGCAAQRHRAIAPSENRRLEAIP